METNEIFPIIFHRAMTLLALERKGKITFDEAIQQMIRFCANMCAEALTYLLSMLYTVYEDPDERKARGEALFNELVKLLRLHYEDFEKRLLHVKNEDLQDVLPDIREKIEDELRKRGAL